MDSTREDTSWRFWVPGFPVVAALVLGYFAVTGFMISFSFYGPWAGLGAHQSPPVSQLVGTLWVLLLIGTLVASRRIFRADWSSSKSSPLTIPVALLVFEGAAWAAFLYLYHSGKHLMIVDDRGPFGASMGESAMKASYLSRLILASMIPAVFTAGLGACLSGLRRQVWLPYVIGLIGGVLWIWFYLGVSGSRPYYY